MEGLLIAEQLRALEPLLPAERGGWRFPDDRTVVLPIGVKAALWLNSRPPYPYVELREQLPEPRGPHTPFQQQLEARAAGPLLSAVQAARDRVLTLRFGAAPGFVPTPGIELVAELTGRNANLVLLEGSTIVGVERRVLADRNRYRELRNGIEYRPPPPYSKLDPLTADPPAIRAALLGVTPARIGRVIDGLGPNLTAALLSAAGAREIDPHQPLEGQALEVMLEELATLTGRPRAYLERWRGDADQSTVAATEREAEARTRLGRLLAAEAELARRRLQDAKDALTAGSDATGLRAEADLLLANPGRVPAGASEVVLTDWSGHPLRLRLDPRLPVAANAARRYDQARRREARAERARAQLPDLEAAVVAADAAVTGAQALEVERVYEILEGAERERSRAQAGPREAGVRFAGPHGFEVVVGRNARDNDRVTFEVARSRDLWLHAQGYRGSHVIVRSGGREVPHDTLLFAARLAAGNSEAGREDQVAVDYTLRKNVWRAKGGPPGAVNFAHHKTVLVAPARGAELARPE